MGLSFKGADDDLLELARDTDRVWKGKDPSFNLLVSFFDIL